MQHVDDSRNGGEVELPVGEEIEVELAENPTTGYRWHLDMPEAAGLVCVEDTFQRSGDALGASGRRRWRFRANHEGVTRIQFAYRRSWERSPTKTFEITIRVAPA